jgi:phosphotriesterase-related protein
MRTPLTPQKGDVASLLPRRNFLAAAALAAAGKGAWAQSSPEPSILVHEHVLVDFIGAAKIGPGRYDEDTVFAMVKPKMDELVRLGCKRFQECTPNFIGRAPRLLRRLTDATGLEIWTNTGLYAARDHIFLPDYARTESPQQLAKRWVAEARSGVDGLKPRFIKIGVNRGPLHPLDRKIVHAAALCAKETGLTIASHTGNGAAAVEQMEILQSEKLPLKKFVWVHADSEKDHGFHSQLAKAGAWVEFDHVGPGDAALAWHLECVQFMDKAGLLGRTLISQDAGYYRPGEPNGGAWKKYTHLYTRFAPKLTAAQRKTLLWENPRAAFG